MFLKRFPRVILEGHDYESRSGSTNREWLATDSDELSGRILECFKTTQEPVFFETFYRLNSKGILEYVSKFKGRCAWSYEPADIVSDIFYDVIRYVNTFNFRDGPSFRGWLVTLAKNRIRKTFKRKNSQGILLLNQPDAIHDKGVGDPLNQIIHREEYTHLWASWWILLNLCWVGIERVTPLEKEVLSKHTHEGLSYRELSLKLCLTPSEVAVISRRSRRKVARFIRLALNRFLC